MTMKDGPRQIVAGVAAALAFLAFFFGLELNAIVSLVLGLAVFGAFLLIVRRRRLSDEIRLSERVTQKDVEDASATLAQAADRLAEAATTAPDADKPVLATLVDHLASIRRSILNDPGDFRPTRRFTQVYLPNLVDSVEAYVKLADRPTTGQTRERVAQLGQRIHNFVPIVQRIDTACIENDLHALEVQLDVLQGQMERG